MRKGGIVNYIISCDLSLRLKITIGPWCEQKPASDSAENHHSSEINKPARLSVRLGKVAALQPLSLSPPPLLDAHAHSHPSTLDVLSPQISTLEFAKTLTLCFYTAPSKWSNLMFPRKLKEGKRARRSGSVDNQLKRRGCP
jgi:hypothetical protein